MPEQFHKDIHKDGFKLRCLLTNSCNRACRYCLNDFQQSSNDKRYINPNVVIETAKRYTNFCELHDVKSEIYFSGGEPTLHPRFSYITKEIANLHPDKLVLCTNGIASIHPHRLGQSLPLCNYFNQLHVSLHNPVTAIEGMAQIVCAVRKSFNQAIEEAKQNNSQKAQFALRHLVFNGVFNPDVEQYAITNYWNIDGLDATKFEQLQEASIDLYEENLADINVELKIKVWADYFKRHDEFYMDQYREFLDTHDWIINRGKNFIPHNRGSLCQGCKKDCVTLKALWLRPDNTASPCPQASLTQWSKMDTELARQKAIEHAYQVHKTIGTGERTLHL